MFTKVSINTILNLPHNNILFPVHVTCISRLGKLTINELFKDLIHMIEQEVAFYKIKPSDVIHINEVIITTMPRNLPDCVFQSH